MGPQPVAVVAGTHTRNCRTTDFLHEEAVSGRRKAQGIMRVFFRYPDLMVPTASACCLPALAFRLLLSDVEGERGHFSAAS
jgi:hypothetical protein